MVILNQGSVVVEGLGLVVSLPPELRDVRMVENPATISSSGTLDFKEVNLAALESKIWRFTVRGEPVTLPGDDPDRHSPH